MEYLHGGFWVYAAETTSEEDAVRRSRELWKHWDVEGVRVLRTETLVSRTATKKK